MYKVLVLLFPDLGGICSRWRMMASKEHLKRIRWGEGLLRIRSTSTTWQLPLLL
jgi:hypothetical protein